MATNASYVLKAHGSIDAKWLQDCLALFKERQICIRKLLFLKNGHPEHFSMLELHFNLPQQVPLQPDSLHPFLILLTRQTEQHAGITHSLSLI